MAISRFLRRIQDGLTTDAQQDPTARERNIRLATGALLLETAHADQSLSLEEEKRLFQHVRRSFELSDSEARELVEAADEFREQSIDYYSLTRVLRDHTSLEDRIEVVKTMWRIVYADGNLHQDESHLIRKLSDLLGVEHHRMIEAKMAVRRELGHEEV